MLITEPRSDSQVAVTAAAAGARVVRAMYGRTDLSRVDKSVSDFATEADLAAEEEIRAALKADRPDDAFLGEETGRSGGRSGRVWLVDPLCGPLNFAARTPLLLVIRWPRRCSGPTAPRRG